MALGWQMPGHYFPWLTFQQEAMAALGACVIALGAWVGGPRQQRTRWPVLALVACAAAATPLLHITHIKPGEVEAVMAQVEALQSPHRVAALESGQSMEFGGDARG